MVKIQFFLISMGIWALIFSVIAGICVYATRPIEKKPAESLLWMLAINAVMNAAGAVCRFLCIGEQAVSGTGVVHILTGIVHMCAFLFIPFMAKHVVDVAEVRGGYEDRRLTLTPIVVAIIGVAAVLLSLRYEFFFTFDARNIICRSRFYPVYVVLAEAALIPILIQIVRYKNVLRKSEFAAFLCSGLLSATGFLLQLATVRVFCFVIAFSLTLIIIVTTHQMGFSKDNIERERTLARTQINLYTRQIQPHFIYNSLSAIRSTLPEDSEAWESLNHFTGFLRGSIDLLTAESCIRAQREFATVQDYLYMEKQRFGEELTVQTDLQDEDFEIPPFTIQTLVENAIQYGIREKSGGKGTLTIRSCRTTCSHMIEVIDDGAGFDIGNVDAGKGEGPHIGISNIRERLRLMCAGSLYIDSRPGVGTLARVEIPIKRGEK